MNFISLQELPQSKIIEKDSVILGDCLEVMSHIADKSIDMILCDLPYGQNKHLSWDFIIPFKPLWEQYERIIKDNGAIVLTATQPFTSVLVMSNPKLFKYELIWLKTRPSNVFNAKKQYMKWHENILVFYKKLPTYNPKMKEGKPYVVHHKKKQDRSKGIYGKTGEVENHVSVNSGLYYPKTIIEISNPNYKSLHPTQKPVELFRYLIRTFSNENDLILDNCLGSGTTVISAIDEKRHYIGIENSEEYYNIAKERIEDYARLR